MLHLMLSELARSYSKERIKSFAGSEFGNFVRHDIALEAKKRLIFLPYELTVKSSVGAGVWAAVPWLGFFDPLITNTAQKGFYVVYLVNPLSEEVYLSLNQGATAAFEEFSVNTGLEVLRRRALDMRDRVSNFARFFDTAEIDLGSDARLPKDYEAGHAFGRKYDARTINSEIFYSDLEKMLAAYSALVDAGGTTPSDIMQEESGASTVEEAKRYIISRRIERAPNVRSKVLSARGQVCEGCGLDPNIHLGLDGHEAFLPLDVHHAKALRELAEGESRRYKIPDDFIVLCPTCHRIIHNQTNLSDLETLKNTIRFRHSRK